MVNRTQGLVLGFFVVVSASLVGILTAAPEVYDRVLRLPSGWPWWTQVEILVALLPSSESWPRGCCGAGSGPSS
jgi:hypothetical protein